MKIMVKVPATSANLGPGFDTLGCAWDINCRLTFEEGGEGLRISGCSEEYRDEKNLAYVAYSYAMGYLGEYMPSGLSIDIESDIPESRGLGSSAAMTVAGLIAANALHGGRLSKDEILRLATKLEGHPDNAAPAIFGGLVASSKSGDRVWHAGYDISAYLNYTLFIPDFPVSTWKARALMPPEIPTDNAVYSLSRLPMLLKGLENASPELLSVGLDDRIHQPYRKQLIADFDTIREKAIENGAYGLVISGSGSVLLSIGGGPDYGKKMAEAVSGLEAKWEVKRVQVDRTGASVTEL
ncbi:MAG: homoserine kinase [Firmicutes bacterium]|nr:homoserine kinase [Bacillota bacterium]